MCLCCSLQAKPNNYETDLIFPILDAAAKKAGIDYHTASEAEKTALKVGATAGRQRRVTDPSASVITQCLEAASGGTQKA